MYIFIALNAQYSQDTDLLEESYQWLLGVVNQYQKGVVILGGHKGDDGTLMDYQDAKIVLDEYGMPTAKEHFGYTDGISAILCLNVFLMIPNA